MLIDLLPKLFKHHKESEEFPYVAASINKKDTNRGTRAEIKLFEKLSIKNVLVDFISRKEQKN